MKKIVFLIPLLVLAFNGCDKKDEGDIKLMGGDKNKTEVSQPQTMDMNSSMQMPPQQKLTPEQQKAMINEMGKNGKFEETKKSFQDAQKALPTFVDCISKANDVNQANTCASDIAKQAGQELKEEEKLKDWNSSVKKQIIPMMKMQLEEINKQAPCVEKAKDMYEFVMCVNPQMIQ
jgi:hypothetical protein